MSIISNPNQSNRLLEYLKNNPSGITITEALSRLGIYSLSSRVSELKRRNVPINSKFVTVTNRFGEEIKIKRYFLSENYNG